MWSKHWAIRILIVSQSDIDWQDNESFFIAKYLEYDETIKALVFIDSLKTFLLTGIFSKERLGRHYSRNGDNQRELAGFFWSQTRIFPNNCF